MPDRWGRFARWSSKHFSPSTLTSIIRNSAYPSAGFVLTSFIALAVTPLMVSHLGTDNYGIYILLTSLVGYYNLVDLGLGQGVTRFVSEHIALNNALQASRYVNAALTVQAALGVGISGAVLLSSSEILSVLKIPIEHIEVVERGLRLCVCGFLCTMLSATFSAALQGLQRFDITAAVDAGANVGLNAVIVVLLLTGHGLYETLVATVVTAGVVLGVNAALLRSCLPTWSPLREMSFREVKSLFGFSSYLFISKASNLFANYVVRFVVAAIAGPVGVSTYVVPARLLGAIGGVLSTGSSVLFPYASSIGAANAEKLKQLYVNGTRVFLSISLPVFAFSSLFSYPLLAVWMGETFAGHAWPVLSVLSVSGAVASQTVVPNQIIAGMGHSRLLGGFGLLGLISYGVFLPALGRSEGVIGIAVGMLCAAVLNFFAVYVMTTRVLRISLLTVVRMWLKDHGVALSAFCGLSLATLRVSAESALGAVLVGSTLLLGYYLYLLVRVRSIEAWVTLLLKKEPPEAWKLR